MATGLDTQCARLFISPHPDDIVFSCYGSLVNAPANPTDALIVTVFDRSRFSFRNDKCYSDELITGWRRDEDRAFAKLLGCRHMSLGLPDSSIRNAGQNTDYQKSIEEEKEIHEIVRAELEIILNPFRGRSPIYVPLALGSHIDHRIVRQVIQEILIDSDGVTHKPHLLLYYEDLPYAQARSDAAIRKQAESALSSNVAPLLVDLDAIWDEKLAGIRVYASQLEASTVSTLKQHAEHVGGGLRRAERLWICKPGAFKSIVDTTVWIGWEAARTLGGHSTVISAMLDDAGFKSAGTRTLLVGPLDMPYDSAAFDVHGDVFDVAARLNAEILYHTTFSPRMIRSTIKETLVTAFRKIECDHGVELILLRDRRQDTHVVERLLIDFQSNISLRRMNSPSLRDFLARLAKEMELSIDCGLILPSPMTRGDYRYRRYLRDTVSTDRTEYWHRDNDSIYGILLAQPAAESVFALLEDEETCGLIVQEPVSIPTAYASHFCENRSKKMRTIFYVNEIRPVANLVDGSVIPEGAFESIPALDYDGPMSTIIQKCVASEARVTPRHFLDLAPLRHISSHLNMKILQHAWKLDRAISVSEKVRDEIRFLDRGFDKKDIQLFTPGVRCIECPATRKEQCRRLLLSYAKYTWNSSLDSENTVTALRISRAVTAKGFHRDLKLMYSCAKNLQDQEKSVLFLLVTSWTPSDSESFDLISSLSHQAKALCSMTSNLHIQIINQYAWPEYPERGARPTGLSRDDLLCAADVSIALSTYDSYNIALLEPLSCGAICVLSGGCGAARRVSHLEGAEEIFVIADFGAEVVGDRIAHLRESNTTRKHNIEDLSLSLGASSNNEICDIEDSNGDHQHFIDSVFALTHAEKEIIEPTVIDRSARQLIAKLPLTAAQRSFKIEKGLALAKQMSWKHEIERGLLPILKELFREEVKEKRAPTSG